MFENLLGFLAKAPRTSSPQKPAPKSGATVPSPGVNFRAVSVEPGPRCCLAAKAGIGKPFLVRDAPKLPLANCTMPTACSCKFRKASDRRDDDRREIGMSETGRWYGATEKRQREKRGRRRTDSK